MAPRGSQKLPVSSAFPMRSYQEAARLVVFGAQAAKPDFSAGLSAVSFLDPE